MQTFKILCLAAGEDRFDAVVMVEMEVLGSQDGGRSIVLNVENFIYKVSLVVIVNETDVTDYLAPNLLVFVCGLVANQGPERIRAGRVFPCANFGIQEFQ
jgi:hypothetical protein